MSVLELFAFQSLQRSFVLSWITISWLLYIKITRGYEGYQAFCVLQVYAIDKVNLIPLGLKTESRKIFNKTICKRKQFTTSPKLRNFCGYISVGANLLPVL